MEKAKYVSEVAAWGAANGMNSSQVSAVKAFAGAQFDQIGGLKVIATKGHGGRGGNKRQQIIRGNAFNEFIGLSTEAKVAANDSLENVADWLVIDDVKETVNGIKNADVTSIAAGVFGLVCKQCKVANKLSDFTLDPVSKAVSGALKHSKKGKLTIDGQDALATIRQQRGVTGTLDTSQSDREFYNNLKRSENELEQKTNRGTRYKWKTW